MSEVFGPAGGYAVTSTRECRHEVWERDDASLDSCPICLRTQLSTATAILKRLVDCAERTVQESRREFARGDILDVDMLEDAAIAARAFVEAADTPTRRADQT